MRKEQKKNQKQQNKTPPNRTKLYHKTNGTAAVNRTVSQAWDLAASQEGAQAVSHHLLTKRALSSGAFRSSDSHLKPSLPPPFSSHLAFPLSLSLPSTFHLSALCSNVFRVLFHPKISVWEIFFSPFAVSNLFFFLNTSLLFPAYVYTSPLLTLLLTAPPKLAPSVNIGVYFLFTSLMKVLNKIRLNMQQDPHLPLNRWFLVVCQEHHSIFTYSTHHYYQEAFELIFVCGHGSLYKGTNRIPVLVGQELNI